MAVSTAGGEYKQASSPKLPAATTVVIPAVTSSATIRLSVLFWASVWLANGKTMISDMLTTAGRATCCEGVRQLRAGEGDSK